MLLEKKNLVIHKDGRGYLFEALRKDDALFEGEFGQVLISFLEAGVTKGLHLHRTQVDYTVCVQGTLWYVAVKENKSGKHEVETILLTEKTPVLVKVPRGVWHGYKAIGGPALVVHVMDKTYDPSDVEERDPMAFGDVWKS